MKIAKHASSTDEEMEFKQLYINQQNTRELFLVWLCCQKGMPRALSAKATLSCYLSLCVFVLAKGEDGVVSLVWRHHVGVEAVQSLLSVFSCKQFCVHGVYSKPIMKLAMWLFSMSTRTLT